MTAEKWTLIHQQPVGATTHPWTAYCWQCGTTWQSCFLTEAEAETYLEQHRAECAAALRTSTGGGG